LPGVVADQAGKRHAAHRRHAQLSQHQVDRRSKHFRRGVGGIVATDDPISGLAQPFCKHRQRAAVRLDDQQTSGAIGVVGQWSEVGLHPVYMNENG